MGLRGQAPLIAAPAALLGRGAVLAALVGGFVAFGALAARGGLVGGGLLLGSVLGLDSLLLALMGGLLALAAAARVLVLTAGQGQGPGGQQPGGGIHDHVAVQGAGPVELGAGHSVPGVHQCPGAHAPAGALVPGRRAFALGLHHLDGLGKLALGLAPASAAALFGGRLGLLQHLGGLDLLLLLDLALLLGRSLGGLVPGPALLPGGGTGLLVLLVDDAAVLIPLGGLEHLHRVGVVLHHGQLPPDQLFDVPQQGLFPEIAEGDGCAPTPGTAGAADAVDIGLRHLGQVIVEHVGQLFDVQPPGGDVSGHQAADIPRLKVGQGLLPGGLALVAVDGGGSHPRLFQIPGHLVGPVLGAGEHQGIFHPKLPHQVGQKAGLVVLVHKIYALLNGLHRGGDGVHRHPGGVVEERVDQVADLRGHGRGEKQGLLLPGQPL